MSFPRTWDKPRPRTNKAQPLKGKTTRAGDLIIRITPSNDDAQGAPAESNVIHVGALSAEIEIGTSTPSFAPSFDNQVPVNLRRNGLPVDEVTLVATFQGGPINLSTNPVALGPAGSAAGATISNVVAGTNGVEFTVGGGMEFGDGTLAFLQFDITAAAMGGSFPIICVADIPTGSGTRGTSLAVRSDVSKKAASPGGGCRPSSRRTARSRRWYSCAGRSKSMTVKPCAACRSSSRRL